MIIATVCCITVIFCVVWITMWIGHMVKHGYLLWTYGECVWKDEDKPVEEETHPIGFVPVETKEEEAPKKPSDKEVKEALLADPAIMFSALLRGEVDIDDITN